MTHGQSHCSDCINLLCNRTLWERGIEWKIKMGRENQIFILSFLKNVSIKAETPWKHDNSYNPKQCTTWISKTVVFLQCVLFILLNLPADHQTAGKNWISGISVSMSISVFLKLYWDRVNALLLRHIMHDVPNILTLWIPPGGRSWFIFAIYHFWVAVCATSKGFHGS